MTRAEALALLCADSRRAEAMLPTLTLQGRADRLADAFEYDDPPALTAADDPADVALGIYRGSEEGRDYRLVGEEQPEDVGNPRYDKVILQVLPGDGNYYGATNAYLSAELARIGHPNVTVTGEPEPLLPYPCCGYRTLAERGQHFACPVCFWGDGGGDDPARYSGPNHKTLAEGRRNFQVFGAYTEGSLRFVVPNPGSMSVR